MAPPVIDEHWAAEIAGLLRNAPRLLAASVFELMVANCYDGSYVGVARHVNTVRGPRFSAAPAASTRIVTAPGEECLCGVPHRSRYPVAGRRRAR
jgi:hypothetical protein